jgi:hypothetical protein
LAGVEAKQMPHFTTMAGAAGLALFGTGALVAPKTFAGQFGLPTEDPVALASVRGPQPQHLVHLAGFIALLLAARRAE